MRKTESVAPIFISKGAKKKVDIWRKVKHYHLKLFDLKKKNGTMSPFYCERKEAYPSI
jgi:hypothetical protein